MEDERKKKLLLLLAESKESMDAKADRRTSHGVSLGVRENVFTPKRGSSLSLSPVIIIIIIIPSSSDSVETSVKRNVAAAARYIYILHTDFCVALSPRNLSLFVIDAAARID